MYDYLMVQPCAPSTNESKIIMFNGVHRYISSITKAGLRRKHTETEMISFAERAIAELISNTNNAFLWECISRVDLFSINGKLYVNEFENLQSQYSYLGKGDKDAVLFVDLCSFYADTIRKIIDEENF